MPPGRLRSPVDPEIGGWAKSLAILLRKLRLLIQREGGAGTVRVGLKKYRYLAEFTPARRRARRQASEFDRFHEVATSAIVDLSELRVEGPSAPFGFRHQPSPPERFTEIIRSLPIRFEDFAFVDLGSGLGRALLLAAQFPFQRIVGVELSRELERVAQNNLRCFRSPRRCARIESVLGDAATFELPGAPLVVYLYNPFDEPVLARCLKNIEHSLAGRPRPIVVVYYYPKLRHVFEGSPALRTFYVGDDVAIYASPLVAPGQSRATVN